MLFDDVATPPLRLGCQDHFFFYWGGRGAPTPLARATRVRRRVGGSRRARARPAADATASDPVHLP